ncbi:MAG: hypothetical protein IKU84_01765 [Clostridia bacterium]|nr:hypothetical protein [Clostridia bacterium]
MVFFLVIAGIVSLMFKPLRKTIFALLGLVGLDMAGVSVGVNLINAALIGLLGISGIFCTLILNIIF